MKTYYLAGKMTGVPRYNIPAFDAAAAALRAKGYSIVSPAELDDPEVRAASYASPDGKGSTGRTWGEFLARDVKIVADDVQGMILLEGWQESRGAKLEVYVGLLCNHEFRLYYRDGRTVEIDPAFVRSFIR